MLNLLAATLLAVPPFAAALPLVQDDAPPAAQEPAAAAKAEEPDTEAWIEGAVQEAAKYLLGTQENYVADRSVGKLPEKRLADWQKREEERLAELRGAEDAAEWPYEGVHRVPMGGGYVIPAGYRVGGTSIVCEALLAAAGSDGPDAPTTAAIERALAFVLDTVEDDPYLEIGPKSGYDVRGWGHAYGLRMLDLLRSRGLVPADQKERVDAALAELVKRLEANQTEQGGWNYAGDMAVSPFMTAATLLILFDAADHGLEVPEEMVTKALDALKAGRTKNGSYEYAGSAGRRNVPMHASCARSAAAELALLKAGRGDIDALRVAIDGFFDGWEHLLDRKSKQGIHEGAYDIAPYYFFFAHTYAAYAIEELPEAECAARRVALAELLRRTRDEDGSWNERVFPRTSSYSTAMTILAMCAPRTAPIATWGEAPAKDAQPAGEKR